MDINIHHAAIGRCSSYDKGLSPVWIWNDPSKAPIRTRIKSDPLAFYVSAQKTARCQRCVKAPEGRPKGAILGQIRFIGCRHSLILKKSRKHLI
jgi:hypothetical protein